MRQQRRTLIGLTTALIALLLVIFFGPDPETDIDRPISEEEIAEWAAQQDTATEDYQIVAAYLIIPADDDPCSEAVAIDLLTGEAYVIPAETKTNEIQYY